jgi:hypothetical protein
MEDNQKELLNRVLLLMKYDNKKTLTENKQNIINEADPLTDYLNQRAKSVPLPSFNDMLGQANWLNAQVDTSTQQFNHIWSNYITNVSSANLDSLLKVQRELVNSGWGPMTPGLYGFNKPNPGIANIPLENQIYALSQQRYEKDKTTKTYYDPKTGKQETYATKPSQPQYNLLPSVLKLTAERLGILYKTATQINNEMISKGKSSQEKTEKKCYFKNNTEGDDFRLYVNAIYPELAKKKKKDGGLELDISGKKSDSYCNNYINDAYNYKLSDKKTIGQKYLEFKSYDPEKAKRDLMKVSREDLGYGGDRLDSNRDNKAIVKKAEEQKAAADKMADLEKAEEENEKQYQQWKDEQLKKYDFSTFPSPIDYYMGKPVYKDKSWKEPKTGRIFFIDGKTLKDIKNDIVSEVEWELQQKSESEILNNPLLVQIFGKEKLDTAIKDCKRENLMVFFNKILNFEYKVGGNTIGKYAIDNKGNSYFVTWPKNERIPCTDEFWDEYGLYIQLGGMLAVGLMTGGLGLTASAALLIELAADTALNLYSLKKSYESGDKDAMKMDLTYVFLPLLMASKPIKALLKSAKFGDDVISSVESKLRSIPQNATTSQVDNVIKNMTPEEQRVIKELGKDEYANEIQKVSKQTLDDLKKTAKGSVGRKLSNPLINLIVYGSPAAVYMVKKISDTYKQKVGTPLSKQEEDLWNKALSFLTDKSQNDLTNWIQNAPKEELIEIKNSKQVQDALKRTQNPENLSKEEINKQGQEILDFVELLKERSKLNLETKEDEYQDFNFDEIDFEGIEKSFEQENK